MMLFIVKNEMRFKSSIQILNSKKEIDMLQ